MSQDPPLRARDLATGTRVRFNGHVWTVWSKGPKGNTFWCKREEVVDGVVTTHTQDIAVRNMTRMERNN